MPLSAAVWVSGESGWYLVSHPRHIGAEARRGRGGHKHDSQHDGAFKRDPILNCFRLIAP